MQKKNKDDLISSLKEANEELLKQVAEQQKQIRNLSRPKISIWLANVGNIVRTSNGEKRMIISVFRNTLLGKINYYTTVSAEPKDQCGYMPGLRKMRRKFGTLLGDLSKDGYYMKSGDNG